MTLQLQDSAVYRCPTEVWAMIIRFATLMPPPASPWGSSFDRVEMISHRVASSAKTIAVQRSVAMADLRNIALVCRQWSQLAAPLLLEWIIVDGPSMSFFSSLLQNFIGDFRKGTRVRRLEFRGSKMSRKGLEEHRVIKIINACPRLEEFLYESYSRAGSSAICSALAQTCGQSLTFVSFNGGVMPSLRDLVDLISHCPRLELLNFERQPQEFHPLDAANPQPVAGPRALRSLSWRTNNATAGFCTYVAQLNLPHLRHINLEYDNNEDPADAPEPLYHRPELKALFTAHGKQILSLEVDLSWNGRDRGVGFTLLEYCPNLQNFVFDFSMTDVRALMAPHPSLRLVIGHSFFSDAQGARRSSRFLDEHGVKVLAVIKAFCGKDFPKLKEIRCTDVQCSTPVTRALQAASGDFPDEYRLLACRAAEVCSKRGLRFENCLGDSFGLDFAPRWYWSATDERMINVDEDDFSDDDDD